MLPDWDWRLIGTIALALTLVAQLVIWAVDRKKKKKPHSWARPPDLPGPMTQSEQDWLARHDQQIKDLARHGLGGRAIPKSTPSPLETRVGGPLIVPKGNAVPTNLQGAPLHPLMLIHLPDLPDTEGNVLAGQGWIQVLLEGPDAWDMPQPAVQGVGLRVEHFAPDTAFDIHPVDPAVALDHPAWNHYKEDTALIERGYSIAFEPVLDKPSGFHYLLEDLPSGARSKEFTQAFDASVDRLEDAAPQFDIMIGGQAAFTQEDIRYCAHYAGYENLIGMSGSGSGIFSWGDAGEATIMVPEKDLRTGRLKDAIFSFDCH